MADKAQEIQRRASLRALKAAVPGFLDFPPVFFEQTPFSSLLTFS